MKKGVPVLTVVLFIVLVAGCLGGNSEQVGPSADSPDTGSDADTDAGTDTDADTNTSDEDTDASEGNGDLINAPEPYTDAVVAFVVDGETRGRLAVEVADQPSERNRGLMERESLPENTGMLFAYRNANVKRFWMKNTLVPLDIIFVDADGRVLNVEHASPGFEGERVCSNPDYYCSDGPAKYVVETKRGYANETGLSPGDRLIVRRLR